VSAADITDLPAGESFARPALAACLDCGVGNDRATATCECGGAVEARYTAPEICALTGATYRQIDYWTRAGRLPETAHGSGSQRRFTPAEVDTVRFVIALLGQGFVLDRAFAIARALVTDDEYRTEFADVFQLIISVRDTAAEPPAPEGTPE